MLQTGLESGSWAEFTGEFDRLTDTQKHHKMNIEYIKPESNVEDTASHDLWVVNVAEIVFTLMALTVCDTYRR